MLGQNPRKVLDRCTFLFPTYSGAHTPTEGWAPFLLADLWAVVLPFSHISYNKIYHWAAQTWTQIPSQASRPSKEDALRVLKRCRL